MDIQQLNTDTGTSLGYIDEWLRHILRNIGIADQWFVYTKLILLTIIVIAIVYILQFSVGYILNFIFKRIHRITRINFFKYLIQNKLSHYLALVIPYSFVRGAIPIMFVNFPRFISPLNKLTDIFMVFMVIWTAMAFLRSCGDVLKERPGFYDKPMKSYMQVLQIIFYIFGAVVMYCIFTGKSPTAFFAAMGAASAVLMLMFKDTIMGFVSSIQLSSNDMLKVGDWITMNKYGADGTVEEINLTTVKIQNFDRTITTIPTYALISDSFQNWRGMQDSGGRRIKRALFIKQLTIRFINNEELEKYKKINGLREYIQARQTEYAKMDKNMSLDNNFPVNGHMVTNCDLFIQYGVNYLRNHPNIRQDMTLLVRQLGPTADGLPIEIYTFTDTTVWAEYEVIMSEIINHFLSVVKYFDLTVYESSSGSDEYNVYLKNKNS